VGRGLDEEPLEGRVRGELSVGQRVQRTAPGQAQVRGAGALVEPAQQVEQRLLERLLDAGGHVVVPLRDVVLGSARRAEQLLRARAVAMVLGQMVVQERHVQHEGARAVPDQDLAGQGLVEGRLTPTGHAHDLVLVPRKHVEAEEVRSGRVELAEGVRELDAPEHLDPPPLAVGEEDRRVLSGAVEGEHRGFIGGRDVKALAAGDVVVDVVEAVRPPNSRRTLTACRTSAGSAPTWLAPRRARASKSWRPLRASARVWPMRWPRTHGFQ
jgi:hypothetical protein